MTELFEARIRKNNRYYDKFSSQVAARTDKRDYAHWFTSFCSYLPTGATVLDIGCGTGLHLRSFQERGYRAIGLEPSQAMRDIAASEGHEVVAGAFETLPTLDLPPIAGIWCAATLLHVPQGELAEVLRHLYNRLNNGGALFLTVRLGQGAMWDRYDEADGDAERLIQLYEEQDLLQALARAGFTVTDSEVEQSYWGRPAPWISLVAVKQP
ncbi:MAG TPA: class I SAM-dependent methyltransferase [Bacilli bacterium]|nr:class I SAM-dependent methyltransferase [Bacilli bacterium]